MIASLPAMLGIVSALFTPAPDRRVPVLMMAVDACFQLAGTFADADPQATDATLEDAGWTLGGLRPDGTGRLAAYDSQYTPFVVEIVAEGGRRWCETSIENIDRNGNAELFAALVRAYGNESLTLARADESRWDFYNATLEKRWTGSDAIVRVSLPMEN